MNIPNNQTWGKIIRNSMEKNSHEIKLLQKEKIRIPISKILVYDN